jgi:hypothetical protein
VFIAWLCAIGEPFVLFIDVAVGLLAGGDFIGALGVH